MRAVTAVLLALAAATAGCEQAAPPAARPLAAATIFPLYEFARHVAGDRVEVVMLVPAGVEPHDWEPAPRDIAQLQTARALVYNGGGLEPWVDRLLPQLGEVVAIDTSAAIALQARDPHVWLDPVLAQAQVEAIRAGLARADPGGADAYAQNARAYTERLGTLHRAFEDGLRDCARRDIVVSHASFGYLARRYGLEQVPVMGLTPEAEPSPADLARIVRLARRRGVQYIFFETLVSARLAETLAREIGARTLVLNPVEGLTKDEAAAGATYVTLMEANLQNLRAALECR